MWKIIRKIVRRIWVRLAIDNCVTDRFQKTPKHKNLLKTTASIEKRIEANWGQFGNPACCPQSGSGPTAELKI